MIGSYSGGGEQNIMGGATRRIGADLGDSTPAIKYNLSDHLGSSCIQLDTSGTTVSLEEYYPFGETSFGSYAKKRYRFCGKEKDEESGLYYYGMRYYSPWTCRFINVDPLAGKYPNKTPYHYCSNNPINRTDPTGMDDISSNSPPPTSNVIEVPENENTTEEGEHESIKEKEDPNKIKQENELKTHKVSSGETFNSIAKKYGLSAGELAHVNNLSTTQPLPVATILKLPGITDTKLNEIENRYRDMIADAREDGYEIAASNLERYLNGVGGTKKIDAKWLKTFDEINEAIEKNQIRFEDKLNDIANNLKEGETKTFTDYWDALVTGSHFGELFYASGTSTLTSTGTFTLTKKDGVITITGTVNVQWKDDYNWDAGKSAYIPGYGTIKDTDANLLKTFRKAKDFKLVSDLGQTTLAGTIKIGYIYNSNTFKWK